MIFWPAAMSPSICAAEGLAAALSMALSPNDQQPLVGSCGPERRQALAHDVAGPSALTGTPPFVISLAGIARVGNGRDFDADLDLLVTFHGRDSTSFTEELQQSLQYRGRLSQVRLADPASEAVGPRLLCGLDAPEHGTPTRKQAQQFGAAMRRVLLVGAQALLDEHIRDPLYALPSQAERASDLGHGRGGVLDRRQDLPARARLAGRARQIIACGREVASEPQDQDGERAERIPGWCAADRRLPYVDSMLSIT